MRLKFANGVSAPQNSTIFETFAFILCRHCITEALLERLGDFSLSQRSNVLLECDK
ncbi:unnamed protein product [Haemonchus placei]|uniref:Uncharacterized protein n=1 Tax=Haemonchus placei TaxID=6290 RepID=A0A3P7T5J8_HAEPC|nr:unnamed protein product [Haemonchus placei]